MNRTAKSAADSFNEIATIRIELLGTEPRILAAKVRLRDVLLPGETVIGYVYDFGDYWEHRLTVSAVRQGDPDGSYPRYVGGERNGPPEDCGGVPGFYAMLEVLADTAHPDHAEVADWLDEYDPDEIDVLPIQYGLSRIARQRNAYKAQLAKQQQLT